jgi:hypothetical protein
MLPQLAQDHADCRLTQIQPIGGSRKASGLENLVKYAKCVQIHILRHVITLRRASNKSADKSGTSAARQPSA